MITVTSIYDEDSGRKVAEVARCPKKKPLFTWREIAAGLALALVVFTQWTV